MPIIKLNNSIIKLNSSIIFNKDKDPNIVVIGGKSYKTTRIGNTIWLAEDLMLTWEGLQLSHFGSWIEASSYTTHNSYPNTYYYNDYAITELKTTKAALLPTGWRIPTEADYQYFIGAFPVLSTARVLSISVSTLAGACSTSQRIWASWLASLSRPVTMPMLQLWASSGRAAAQAATT